jgi:hypothetical protein
VDRLWKTPSEVGEKSAAFTQEPGRALEPC